MGFLEDRAAVARVQVGRGAPPGGHRRVGWWPGSCIARLGRATRSCIRIVWSPTWCSGWGMGGWWRWMAARCLSGRRAAGSIYQNELQRLLSLRLGVTWGPDRHNTREMVGVTAGPVAGVLQAQRPDRSRTGTPEGRSYESPALRMAADDEASLATRGAKDHSLTPQRAGRPVARGGGRGRLGGRGRVWTGCCVGVTRTWWPRGGSELTAGAGGSRRSGCAPGRPVHRSRRGRAPLRPVRGPVDRRGDRRPGRPVLGLRSGRCG